MKTSFIAFLAVVLTVVSCKKPKETPDPVPPVPITYMSMTAGNSWTYETKDNTTTNTTTNISTSTSRDSSIIGKSYHVFTNSNGAPNDYYNLTGSDYYTYRSISAALGTPPIEVIYLKDAAASTSWSQTVNVPVTGLPAPVPVTFTNNITSKGLSRTVNGKAYTDVIQVTTTVAVTGLPPGSVTTDIQSYYAPKYGLIENKNKISLPLLTINIDQNTILKSSVIQ